MRIDIWSDVICPYCWIGKRHLESALADFRGKNPGAEVEVVWRAFELDPDAPVQATETTPQMLSRKYGVPLERAEAMQRQMAATFEGLGLEFNWREAKVCNSFDAHRLAALARARGLADAVDEALKKAHFTDGEEIADHAVLRRIGRDTGLPDAEVTELLDGDGYADEVRRDIEAARQIGIGGVPFFVFGGRLAVNGAQPVDVFRQALDQAWEEERKSFANLTGVGGAGAAGAGAAGAGAAGADDSAAGAADGSATDSTATDSTATDGPDCSDGSCSI